MWRTQTANTNANGLVSVQLGGGTAVSGAIASIPWESGPYFLRTETDPSGGGNYTIDGANELLNIATPCTRPTTCPDPQDRKARRDPPGVMWCAPGT
ncbi:MAG: hypothetical protein R2815_10100 [Flavobacteriales bacterium]